MARNSKLDKLNKYAIPNLYYIILGCTIMGYLMCYLTPQIYEKLTLVPYLVVVNHEYWRLFTWIFTIPFSLGFFTLIFLPITLYFYYSIGRRMEMYWGRFIYNLYVLGGMLLTNIAVLLGAFFRYYWSSNAAENIAYDKMLIDYNYLGFAAYSTTELMYMSIFLAFAIIGGENIIYIYFVIPLKMKWLAYFDMVLLAYLFLTGDYFARIVILASVFNYLIYVVIVKMGKMPGPSTLKRRREFENAKKGRGKKKHKTRKKSELEYNSDGTIKFPQGSKIIPPGYGNPAGVSIHKCAVCGKTENDDPDLEFRFCSKCNGNYEYCSEHLYTHTHVSE